MSESPLCGRTLLVIEDDDDHREIVRRLLESLGAHVVLAADGLEGLAQLERRPPDAILCDLTMPIMDGLEFARRMRQDPRYRRVLLVALTGRGGSKAMSQTWIGGFDVHLVKPITIEALGTIAQRLSGGSPTDTEPRA
jgi:CheY-like chemotaxis protein